MLPIALTSGDPKSVSNICTLKSWTKLKDTDNVFFIVASIQQLQESNSFNIPIKEIKDPAESYGCFHNALPVINIENNYKTDTPSKLNYEYVFSSINQCLRYIEKHQASSIVTNPICKNLASEYLNKTFIGHTEYLFEKDTLKSSSGPVMILSSNKCRVIPLTTHVPIKDVSTLITKEKIINTCKTAHMFMKKYYNISSPKITVLGLNPHCGENGTIGTEEINIIQPAISELNKNNINAFGPVSADTAFHNNTSDIIIGMYHDQVLAPFKALSFNDGVNITAGLSFIRTSVDHGTAFDIANQWDKISETSLIKAIETANQLYKNT